MIDAAALEELGPLLTRLSALVAPITPVPLAEWIARVMARYDPPRPRSTRLRLRQALGLLSAHLGAGATTADLTPGAVDSFARSLIEDGSRRAETVNGLLRAVRSACRLAKRWRLVGIDPFSGFTAWAEPDDEPGRVCYHSRSEVARVLAHLRADRASWRGHRLYALACVYAYTGLRKLEALRLRTEDVDFRQRVVFVRRSHRRRLKTLASAAPVPMPGALITVLREWIPRCGGEWVFPGLRREGPWIDGSGDNRATAALRKAAEAIGVKGFTPQSLRHSLATHLTGWHGLTEAQVKLILRHTSIKTQGHYVHADVAALAAIVRDFRYRDGTRRSA